MDIQEYQSLDSEAIKTKLRALPRSLLDAQIRHYGAQYALLCQRLEALYSPDRMELFAAIRPGGLDEIDKAIELAGLSKPKEVAMLVAFRELNRVLLPFMDVYEENVLSDLQYMSRNELEALDSDVSAQLASAQASLKDSPEDYRRAQNAGGTLRLATLMKERIHHELKERFGVSSDDNGGMQWE